MYELLEVLDKKGTWGGVQSDVLIPSICLCGFSGRYL